MRRIAKLSASSTSSPMNALSTIRTAVAATRAISITACWTSSK